MPKIMLAFKHPTCVIQSKIEKELQSLSELSILKNLFPFRFCSTSLSAPPPDPPSWESKLCPWTASKRLHRQFSLPQIDFDFYQFVHDSEIHKCFTQTYFFLYDCSWTIQLSYTLGSLLVPKCTWSPKSHGIVSVPSLDHINRKRERK